MESVETVTVLMVDHDRLRAVLIGQTGHADTCVFMFSPARVGCVHFCHFCPILYSYRASVPAQTRQW